MNLLYYILIGVSAVALYLSLRQPKSKTTKEVLEELVDDLPGDPKKIRELFGKGPPLFKLEVEPMPLLTEETVVLKVGDWYINSKTGKSFEIVSIGEVSVRVREDGARSSHNVHKAGFHSNHTFEEEA